MTETNKYHEKEELPRQNSREFLPRQMSPWPMHPGPMQPPMFQGHWNDAQMYQYQWPNNHQTVHPLPSPFFHQNSGNINVNGYYRWADCGREWQCNVNVNVNYQRPQQHTLNGKYCRTVARRLKKRARNTFEAHQRFIQTDRRVAQQQTSNHTMAPVLQFQPPKDQGSSIKQKDSVQRNEKRVESLPTAENPTPTILPWQLNPLEPTPVDFGWKNWKGYDPL